MNLRFRISVEIDERSGRIMAAYLQVRKGKATKVVEHAEGNAFANYNRKGELLGIELLGPCRLSILDKVAETKPVRDFVRRVTPREMALAK